MSASGLLFVTTERGSAISEDAFEDWYNNEHIPLRLSLPGPIFRRCSRWTAVDGQTPFHLALYELPSPETIHSPPYVALANSRSGRELDILSKLEYLDRRVYASDEVASKARAGYDADAPGPFLMVVTLPVKDTAEAQAEVTRWYVEEHIDMLAKVPGWVRSRVFVLKEVLGVTGTSVDGSVQREGPTKMIAIHEWESPAALKTQELKDAVSTPWAVSVTESALTRKYDGRVYKLFKAWANSQ